MNYFCSTVKIIEVRYSCDTRLALPSRQRGSQFLKRKWILGYLIVVALWRRDSASVSSPRSFRILARLFIAWSYFGYKLKLFTKSSFHLRYLNIPKGIQSEFSFNLYYFLTDYPTWWRVCILWWHSPRSYPYHHESFQCYSEPTKLKSKCV